MSLDNSKLVAMSEPTSQCHSQLRTHPSAIRPLQARTNLRDKCHAWLLRPSSSTEHRSRGTGRCPGCESVHSAGYDCGMSSSPHRTVGNGFYARTQSRADKGWRRFPS